MSQLGQTAAFRASSRWTTRAHSPAGTRPLGQHLAGFLAFPEELGVRLRDRRHTSSASVTSGR